MGLIKGEGSRVCYQSRIRGHAMMNALTVLLLCLTAACAVPVYFPAEKTVIYNYYADVKAGTIEPVQYASEFALTGQLHIRKDVSDPSSNAYYNAYYIKLNNLKYGMFNGMVEHHQPIEVVHELGEAAQQIQEPFVIVYNENGKFEGVQIPENESGWSRNIKQGIASMLQLDLTHVQLQTPMRPHSFVTHEKTIHGTCQVTYDIRPKSPANNNVFVVHKMHDLMNCSHFVQRVFDHVECEKCHVESMDDMTTAARRIFEIEQQDNDVIIKRMVAHSVINYFPYNAQSEAHYLLTNITLDLHSVESVMETPLTAVNLQTVPIIRDVTFNKPMGNYALHAAEDLTHGRHSVKLDTLIPKLKKMLAEAVDYLEENHLEAKEPDWKHGQTVNRLQHTMSYMDLGSLEQVYNAIQDPKTPKEETMKNIFLQMIPTVGTTAACHFTRNVIRKHKVNDATAVLMLIRLSMHVKIPSERLLLEMEDLLKLNDTVSMDVRMASILCFSILIRKTFIHQQDEIVNPLLERYVHRFLDHVKNEQLYQMKMIYLMAMKNVQVGGIEKLLEPIIRGEVSISENPHHIRVQAIWAIKKAVADKVEYTHDLLWPILTDVTQPLPIRIVAYDVLMSQMPNMQQLMSMYWLMIHEQNNHMYNYHYTTLKGLANSVDPCLTPVREMARKVLRFTKMRPTTIVLSYHKLEDYTDPMYKHGESWKFSMVLDEMSSMPQAGYVEYHTSVARKPVDRVGIYWSANGLDKVMKMIMKELMSTTVENLNNKNVQNILLRASLDMPKKKSVHLDICITLNGYVVTTAHYDQNTYKIALHDMFQKIKQMVNGNMQHIAYDTFYEMQVPTDMGLQAVLSTKIPQLWSVKFNNIYSEVKKPSVNTKLEIDARVWRHGEYVMSIYNPVADVWHSIRRATVQDVAVPIDMSVNYNHETKSLKITMPRLPATKLSYTGMRFHAKNLVTITEDEQDVLKVCCATCHHHTAVTTGEKKNYHVAVDSKDMGLKFSMAIFDCENNVTPVTNAQEWQRVLSPEHKNTWGSELKRVIMGVRQKISNDFISPQMGSCGKVMKMEPSIVHPTSHVDLNVRVNVENVNHGYDKMHMINSNKINIRGTLDAKAASTNESVRSWDMNVNIDMSQGHVINNVKAQMTRVTPGEKNLKICVDGQKSYPVVESDPLKVDTSKQETNTKMTITAGFTDEDKCIRDDMSVVISVKGEMTEEQKKQMAHDSVHGACAKDIQKPQFQTKKNYVPKTMNCIHESIQYTTMKKYIINASYKKVPIQVFSQLNQIDDHFRAWHLPHVSYIIDRTPSGNAQMVIEFSSDLSHVNATVVTPVSGYKYVQVPLHQQSVFEGMSVNKAVSHPVWHALMDNTRFSVTNLYKVLQGHSKTCTVYPTVMITFDNGIMRYVFPDEWTLVSGDHIDQTYAVFVKSVQNDKLAMKVYIAGHKMIVMPNDVGVVVSVDDNMIDQHKGIVIPQDDLKSYAMKITENYEHLVVQSQRVPMIIMWTSESVTLMMSTDLQGYTTGICGHMDDTHKEKLPKIYTAAL